MQLEFENCDELFAAIWCACFGVLQGHNVAETVTYGIKSIIISS